MNHQVPSAEILRKYLANQCSDEERDLVDLWYSKNNHVTHETFAAWDEEVLFSRIQTQILKEGESEKKLIFWPRVFWSYAVAIAAMLILCIGFLYFSKSQPGIATQSRSDSSLVFTNKQHKILRFQLPDKSIVWLQPDARISYPAAFVKNKFREVRFEGEGFFEVARDVHHPFIVYSGELKTQVLGTSFNIKANKNESSFQVSVVTGCVSVSSPNGKNKIETVVLKPKQQVVFQKSKHTLIVDTIKEEPAHAENWQPVSLSFDETPMSEAALRLEQTFGIDIEFGNENIKNCRLTIDLNNQRLPEILEMIDTLLGTTYAMNSKKITITGEGCGKEN